MRTACVGRSADMVPLGATRHYCYVMHSSFMNAEDADKTFSIT